MPKFLDVPQWYVSDGTLMSLPKDKPSQYLSTLKTNSDGTTKWEKAAVDSCNGSVDGGAMIYAPISAGSYGQIAVSTGAVPSWATLGINGKTGFALGDNIKIYAPTSNPPGGYVLTSSGSGEPVWKSPLYQHSVLVKFNNSSSYKGSFTFSLLDPSAVLYDTTQLFTRTRKIQDFDSESTLLPITGTGVNSTSPYNCAFIFYGAAFTSASITLYGLQILDSGTVQLQTGIYTKSSITNVYDTVTNIIG